MISSLQISSSIKELSKLWTSDCAKSLKKVMRQELNSLLKGLELTTTYLPKHLKISILSFLQRSMFGQSGLSSLKCCLEEGLLDMDSAKLRLFSKELFSKQRKSTFLKISAKNTKFHKEQKSSFQLVWHTIPQRD